MLIVLVAVGPLVVTIGLAWWIDAHAGPRYESSQQAGRASDGHMDAMVAGRVCGGVSPESWRNR